MSSSVTDGWGGCLNSVKEGVTDIGLMRVDFNCEWGGGGLVVWEYKRFVRLLVEGQLLNQQKNGTVGFPIRKIFLKKNSYDTAKTYSSRKFKTKRHGS